MGSGKVGMLTRTGPTFDLPHFYLSSALVSFHRLFLGGLLPS